MMNDKHFWQLIEDARDEALRMPRKQFLATHEEALTDRLSELSREDLIAFSYTLALKTKELETGRFEYVCALVTGFSSTDGFNDFVQLPVAMGRKSFDMAANDPDGLVPFFREHLNHIWGEDILYGPLQEVLDEEEIEFTESETTDSSESAEPSKSDEWEGDLSKAELKKRLPKLFAYAVEKGNVSE